MKSDITSHSSYEYEQILKQRHYELSHVVRADATAYQPAGLHIDVIMNSFEKPR